MSIYNAFCFHYGSTCMPKQMRKFLLNQFLLKIVKNIETLEEGSNQVQ